MTTTTLTLIRERAMQTTHRSVREVTGWNRRATVYWSAVGLVCLFLERIHP